MYGSCIEDVFSHPSLFVCRCGDPFNYTLTIEVGFLNFDIETTLIFTIVWENSNNLVKTLLFQMGVEVLLKNFQQENAKISKFPKCQKIQQENGKYCGCQNWGTLIEDMPAIEKCEGCCVKLVQNIGSPLYSVRRTCTDNLGQISNI